MTADQLLLLLPIILVSATAVVVMLMIAFRRRHFLSCMMSCTGLFLALLSLVVVAPLSPGQVTPLLSIDAYANFFTGLILLAAIAICLFSYSYLSNLEDHKEEFYLLLAIATLGALLLVQSTHFVSAFLGMEILGISLYGMAAYPLHQQRTAQYPLEASFKYLVLSAVSSGFVLFGMALIYAQTGTLAFSDLGPEYMASSPAGSAYFAAASLLILSGFAFKLSLVPFHLWTPDVYEGAPVPTTTYLATIGKLAMFGLLLRFTHITGILDNALLLNVLALVAAASMLIGNLLALRQQNLKRLLAYSSIAHMGYLLFALLAGAGMSTGDIAPLGNEAVVFYLVTYTVMSLGAFGVLAILSDSAHEADLLDTYQGMFWRDPWLASILIVMLLSLAGIPLTMGFIGKFYVFAAGVQAGYWWLLLVMVVGSGIGLYYYLRVVYTLIAGESRPEPLTLITEARHLLPHCVLALVLVSVLYYGILPGQLMNWVQSALTGL